MKQTLLTLLYDEMLVKYREFYSCMTREMTIDAAHIACGAHLQSPVEQLGAPGVERLLREICADLGLKP